MLFRSLFRGLRPEAGNAGSRGDLSYIFLEALETLLQFRSAHVRPLKPPFSKSLTCSKKERERERDTYIWYPPPSYLPFLGEGMEVFRGSGLI